MRAAIYSRISADREGAGLGVQTQEADSRDLAASLPAEIVAVYTDNDLSALQRQATPRLSAAPRRTSAPTAST